MGGVINIVIRTADNQIYKFTTNRQNADYIQHDDFLSGWDGYSKILEELLSSKLNDINGIYPSGDEGIIVVDFRFQVILSGLTQKMIDNVCSVMFKQYFEWYIHDEEEFSWKRIRDLFKSGRIIGKTRSLKNKYEKVKYNEEDGLRFMISAVFVDYLNEDLLNPKEKYKLLEKIHNDVYNFQVDLKPFKFVDFVDRTDVINKFGKEQKVKMIDAIRLLGLDISDTDLKEWELEN